MRVHTELDVTPRCAPLVKWPGGKRALLSTILRHVPNDFGTYYEPFVGGGALFFALAPKASVLSDLNQELITCYRCVKENIDDVLRVLRRYRNTEDEYYRIRDLKPRSEASSAARLLYLTRLSFNGIHRVNLRGEFNVPYGHKTHLAPFDKLQLLATSDALQQATLRSGDFERSTNDAGPGDLVYFDPPYTVAHANNGFVKYNEHIFSWADQVRLANHAKSLAARGCHVLISNADHHSVSALYGDAKKITMSRHSIIAASGEFRRPITESLFVYRGRRND